MHDKAVQLSVEACHIWKQAVPQRARQQAIETVSCLTQKILFMLVCISTGKEKLNGSTQLSRIKGILIQYEISKNINIVLQCDQLTQKQVEGTSEQIHLFQDIEKERRGFKEKETLELVQNEDQKFSKQNGVGMGELV